MKQRGNVFEDTHASRDREIFNDLASVPGLRVERIVSSGQATPPGEWLDQDGFEWVLLLAGAATIRLESEPEARRLKPGDWLAIPAHCRHRVEWTAPDVTTIWLAVHRVA